MSESRYITLAIHTYEYAAGLKSILEENGIKAELQSVNLNKPELSSGVRIRIPEECLPHALRIIEASQHLTPAVVDMKLSGMSSKILIPIDFSDYSLTACKVGFSFAALLHLHPVLLNVFSTPYFDGSLPLADTLSAELRDSEVRRDLEDTAKKEMQIFTGKIREAMTKGLMPNIKYSTLLSEGVPEEVIINYAKTTPPELIVMATRGKDKKALQLIGSVAAEVLDSCRVPVLTVPEGCEFSALSDLSKVAFFCNIDQQDLLAMDLLERLTHYMPKNICIIPVNERIKGDRLISRTDILLQYFRAHYPESQFSAELLSSQSFRDAFESLVKMKNITFLVVPNKKKNIFARLFSPSIAHKILFERDIPMLALPV